MVQKKEEKRVRELLQEAVTILCRTSLQYRKSLSVEGLIGITLDNEEIVLVNINEQINKDEENGNVGDNETRTESEKCEDNHKTSTKPVPTKIEEKQPEKIVPKTEVTYKRPFHEDSSSHSVPPKKPCKIDNEPIVIKEEIESDDEYSTHELSKQYSTHELSKQYSTPELSKQTTSTPIPLSIAPVSEMNNSDLSNSSLNNQWTIDTNSNNSNNYCNNDIIDMKNVVQVSTVVKSESIDNALDNFQSSDSIYNSPSPMAGCSQWSPENSMSGQNQSPYMPDMNSASFRASQILESVYKRGRKVYSRNQIVALEGEFQKDMYLSGKRRTIVAMNLNLTEMQVKVWFQNRRMKMKRELKDLKHVNYNVSQDPYPSQDPYSSVSQDHYPSVSNIPQWAENEAFPSVSAHDPPANVFVKEESNEPLNLISMRN